MSTPSEEVRLQELMALLFDANATIEALLSGQIDAVVDSKSQTPVLLSKAQSALRESEESYRQIVEATTDGIIKVAVDGTVVFANRRFAEMLGYQPTEVVGISVFRLMSADAGTVASTFMREDAEILESLDSTFQHKDGTAIFVNIAGSSIVDDGGVKRGYLGVVRDITERKKMQSQLMVSDRMASVGTLAAGVAHEINNPLAAVIANLDFIEDAAARMKSSDGGLSPAWLRDEIRAPLDDAREAAQRVRMIVRDLKIFSRSPTEEPSGPVDVKMIMESSLRMAWNEIRHRARLVKDYGAVPGVAANEARLGQVFLNLVVNAAQSIPDGRAELNEIRVTTSVECDRVLIDVRDTGAGIPPEVIPRIFDAFFTTKAVGLGTGLGLAICHRIISDMAGTLTVTSEVGRGTTFRVSLPVARVPVATKISAPAQVAPVGRRGRILVVDDETLVGNSVKRVLSKGHDVLALCSARDALSLCTAGESFDLILCDLMMPDMTGMELHRQLARHCPELADRMIFMTGGAFTAEARQFLDRPMEHIEKPFDSNNLRALVQRYLR